MKLLIIDNAEPEDAAFNQPLVTALSALVDATTVSHRQVTNDGQLLNAYNAVVLTGVPLHYSFETIAERSKRLGWLYTKNIPTLAVCLGHQSVGLAFGAYIIHEVEAENGPCTLHRVERPHDAIFHNLADSFDVEALHRGSISLPESFQLLASSATCKNQLMRHKTKPIYGMQFHPESSETGKTLLANFVDIARGMRA